MKKIAFVPVRGGSKSIPLKNIKDFCGKPLVCWLVEALDQAQVIDKVIVATDSLEIEDVINKNNYSNVEVYRRSAENAQDTSSTESVMLEYLNSTSDLNGDDLFILAQATSPFTQSKDIDGAVNYYLENNFDSLLTCSVSKRFIWDKSGVPKNYDYKKRPRRQDFDGELMENGAFYINTVSNVKKDFCRLSGSIGIFELPEYFLTEIDEIDDWHYSEFLMRKYVLQKSKSPIKIVLSDVDGVLTDAGMYYTESGDELKKFNTRDGMGFELLRKAGLKTGIITSEDTEIVKRRGEKLKVDHLYQGKRDGGKLEAILDICSKEGLTLNEVAYIGDDVNCINALSNVGFAACPFDASIAIKKVNNIHILNSKGGEGAFREFAEIILESLPT